MSHLGKLRSGAKEAIGETSSLQRWLALHLRTATSECLQCTSIVKMESGDRGEGFLAGDRLLGSEWEGSSNKLHGGSDLKWKPRSQFLRRGLHGLTPLVALS